MEDLTVPAKPDLTLNEFVDRLAANQCVTGVLLMGSAATGALNPWSDYDLLVVFEELPAPLELVTTWVDGRLTEVFCATAGAIRRIAGGSTFPATGEEGVVVGWFYRVWSRSTAPVC